MFNGVVKIVKKGRNIADVTKSLKELENTDILIGIPSAKTARNSDGSVNNAELGYILSEGVQTSEMRDEVSKKQDGGSSYPDAVAAYIASHGDPAFAIPPRPFLQPSIEANQDLIAKQQSKIIQTALNKPQNTELEIRKLGMLGQNLARGWFTDPRNGWPPNAPSTVARKGSDRPNIDTGQLRRAITYVVYKK